MRCQEPLPAGYFLKRCAFLSAGSTYILKLSEGIPNTFNLTLYSLFQ